jgi:hypothetical protein
MKDKNYEMITLKAYLDDLENETKSTSWEEEIRNKVERQYLELANSRKSSKVAA